MNYSVEYALVNETDLQRLQNKVNALTRDGYAMLNAYGVAPTSPHELTLHVVWMVRPVPDPAAGSGAIQ